MEIKAIEIVAICISLVAVGISFWVFKLQRRAIKLQVDDNVINYLTAVSTLSDLRPKLDADNKVRLKRWLQGVDYFKGNEELEEIVDSF